MSRSNPTSTNPNPCQRWFEWKGGEDAGGKLVYFDRDTKETMEMKDGFRFLVLEQLSTVTGYNKKVKSGIHSNEVLDVSADVLVVKFFHGGPIASGIWSDIKERVAFKNGKFASSVYIAFKDEDGLKIGNIRMSGCALGPWFDFVKKHRKEVWEKAIVIRNGTEDTSGSVNFVPPVFSIVDVSAETNEEAVTLDRELQEFLAGYFKRSTTEKLKKHEEEEEAVEEEREPEPPARGRRQPDPDLDVPADDDIPF